jgi:hypothetical protein
LHRENTLTPYRFLTVYKVSTLSFFRVTLNRKLSTAIRVFYSVGLPMKNMRITTSFFTPIFFILFSEFFFISVFISYKCLHLHEKEIDNRHLEMIFYF